MISGQKRPSRVNINVSPNVRTQDHYLDRIDGGGVNSAGV